MQIICNNHLVIAILLNIDVMNLNTRSYFCEFPNLFTITITQTFIKFGVYYQLCLQQ